MKDDPIVGRMKVSTLIETLPGYGQGQRLRKSWAKLEIRPKAVASRVLASARKQLCSSASRNSI